MSKKRTLPPKNAHIFAFFGFILVTVFTVMLVTITVGGRPDMPQAAQLSSISFIQKDWSGGGGQSLFIQDNKFLSQDTLVTDAPGVVTLPPSETVFQPNSLYSPSGAVQTVQTGTEPELASLYQNVASVARLTNGKYIAVWYDASSSSSISGKLFDTNPATVESPFEISTADAPPSGSPSVAPLPNGRFVVTWTGTDVLHGAASGRAVFYRRFDGTGVAQDAEAIVVGACPKRPAPYTGASCVQFTRSIASDSTGRFYIVWTNRNVDFTPPFAPSYLTVHQAGLQDVESDVATELYSSTTVDSDTSEFNISVTATDTDVAMVWQDVNIPEFRATVWTPDGTPKAAEKFTVAALESSGSAADMAIAPDGSLRIAYVTTDPGGACTVDGEHARVIHYQQDGTLIGSPIDVETNPASGCEWQQIPALAMLETGDFVISWSQFESATPTFGAQDVSDIYVQVISATDTAITAPTRITPALTNTNDADVFPSIAYDPENAQVMFGWQSWVDSDLTATHFESALYDLSSLYATTGELLSSVAERDGGIWGQVSYSATAPEGTSVSISVRTGPTITPDGSWSDFVTVPNGGSVPSDIAEGQFLQYMLTLTSNGTDTPVVDEVTIELLGAGGITRIDESDPVTLAIELSKLNYPSNQSAQNVLIARSDNVVDTLTATSFARLVNAPILLTDSAELLPDVLTEVQRVMSPSGTVYLAGGTAALSATVENDLQQAGFTTSRFNGVDRNNTAHLIADTIVATNPNPTTSVLLAENRAFADSLGGGAAAGLLQDGNVLPVVLTERGALTLSPDAEAFFGQNAITLDTVYVLGGPVAITDDAQAAVKTILPTTTITRFSGEDRFETNALLNASFFAAPSLAVVANGQPAGLLGARSGASAAGGFFSALLAGTAATTRSAPLVISAADSLSSFAEEYLSTYGSAITEIIMVGSEDLLSAEVESQLQALL